MMMMMASRLVGVLRSRSFASMGPSATAGEHSGGLKLWKKLSLFIAFPGIALCWVNSFVLTEKQHERPEFIPYEHLRLRSKAFPWGDGNHTLFHNKHTNPLPDGYEN